MPVGRVVVAGFLAVAVLILSSPGAFAQGQTGSIAGVVRDTSGAVLPGVTVEASSPALIEKSRSVVTDGQGRYTIVDLRPGTYTVTFTLPGFATVRREGIELTSGFTANVSADLKVGTIEETVTVTGESPIVDTQNTVKLATASREVMDVLPTDRNFVSFAALTPSVLVTGVRQNVGGSIPETGMNLVVHGSRASRQPHHRRGHADHQRRRHRRPDVRKLSEQRARAGDHLPDRLAQRRIRTRDRLSNFIPKEGSNTFRGHVSGRYAGEWLAVRQSRRGPDGAGPQHGQSHRPDLGHQPDSGGPIIRDRLWVYGGVPPLGHVQLGCRNRSRTRTSPAIFYEPVTTEQNLFPVWHQSAVARFTSQLSQKNKLNVYYDWQYTFFGNCFVPTYLTAISACPEYKNIPQYIVQAAWSSPVTNKLLLEAGGTITPQDFHGYRRPGVSETQFSITDTHGASGVAVDVGLARQTMATIAATSRTIARSAWYVTGSHAIKAGFTLLHAWRYNTQEAEQLGLAQRSAARSAVFTDPIRHADSVPRDAALQHGHLRAGSVAHQPLDGELRRPSRLCSTRASIRRTSPPGRSRRRATSTRSRTCRTGRTSNPRVGVVYDLFGDGKTAVKASVGRYVVGEPYDHRAAP